MRKIHKGICLLLLVTLLLFSNICCFVCSAETNLDPFLDVWGLKGKAVVEYIDGVRYVYVVENGKATIFNILIGSGLNDEKFFVLPETLGGYPVTSLGYYSEKRDSCSEVFVYLYNDEEEYKDIFPDYDCAPEYDGNVYKKSREDAITMVIPEGYERIERNALNGFSGYIVFPKSLKFFSNESYICEEFYGSESFFGESTFVFPECEYNSNFSFDFVNDSIIFPSRTAFVPSELWGFAYEPLDDRLVLPLALCFPSNVSLSDLKKALYDSKGKPISYYKEATIYCPPDSEFISTIEEMGGYEINTNVTVAEYIEFPEETVNVCVGDVVDLEAKTYPAEAVWTACDYTVSDPSIVQIDDYSGRITALKEGTVTVTATHCERGFVDTCTVNVTTEPEPVSGVQKIEPATDTPYFSYGNRDYKLELTGSPSKIQVVRKNGATTTIDRSKAQITSNGETETWVVNMRVEAGEHSIRAKYGKVWDEASVPFTVTYDTPKARSFDITYEKGVATFEVVTDPKIAKIQFVLDNGNTLTYTQSISYIGEDGLRHWTVMRKASAGTNYTLKTKLGYTWTTTDLKATT